MKLPTLFYRDGGTFQRPGGTFSTLAINTPEQAVEAAKAGWFPSLPEALGQPAPAPAADLEPPVADSAGGAAMFDVSAMNRAQLIEAATFLGVKDAAKLKDGKLREAVKSAMAAQASTDGNGAGA